MSDSENTIRRLERMKEDAYVSAVFSDVIDDALALLAESAGSGSNRVREKPERLLPCKCGCKRREHWYSNIPERKEILRCHKCGFEAAGKNKIEAHKNWNKEVSKDA